MGALGDFGRLGCAVPLFYIVEGAGVLGRLSVVHGESLCGINLRFDNSLAIV